MEKEFKEELTEEENDYFEMVREEEQEEKEKHEKEIEDIQSKLSHINLSYDMKDEFTTLKPALENKIVEILNSAYRPELYKKMNRENAKKGKIYRPDWDLTRKGYKTQAEDDFETVRRLLEKYNPSKKLLKMVSELEKENTGFWHYLFPRGTNREEYLDKALFSLVNYLRKYTSLKSDLARIRQVSKLFIALDLHVPVCNEELGKRIKQTIPKYKNNKLCFLSKYYDRKNLISEPCSYFSPSDGDLPALCTAQNEICNKAVEAIRARYKRVKKQKARQIKKS